MHSATWSPGTRPIERNSRLSRLAAASSSPNVGVQPVSAITSAGLSGVLTAYAPGYMAAHGSGPSANPRRADRGPTGARESALRGFGCASGQGRGRRGQRRLGVGRAGVVLVVPARELD